MRFLERPTARRARLRRAGPWFIGVNGHVPEECDDPRKLAHPGRARFCSQLVTDEVEQPISVAASRCRSPSSNRRRRMRSPQVWSSSWNSRSGGFRVISRAWQKGNAGMTFGKCEEPAERGERLPPDSLHSRQLGAPRPSDAEKGPQRNSKIPSRRREELHNFSSI